MARPTGARSLVARRCSVRRISVVGTHRLADRFPVRLALGLALVRRADLGLRFVRARHGVASTGSVLDWFPGTTRDLEPSGTVSPKRSMVRRLNWFQVGRNQPG